MTRQPPRPAAALLAALAPCLTLAANADPRDSAAWSDIPSAALRGSAENAHTTLSAAGGYTASALRLSASLSSVIPTTYASEARLRITAPSGRAFTLQPFADTEFTSLAIDRLYLLPTAEPAQGSWDIELFESFDDGPGPDALWTAISITLDDAPPPPPPANDACANATPVPLGSVSAGSTATATNDGPGSCGDSNTSPDVWFTFTAPFPGQFRFSTCGDFGFDTVLSLFDACGGPELECVDDTAHGCAESSLLSEVRRSLNAGDTVLIRLAGYAGAAGDYTLSVDDLPPAPPANDACANAAPLTPGTPAILDTRGAADSNLPACTPDGLLHRDVFFTVTAPCNGLLTISTCDNGSAPFDTAIVVLDACGGPASACADAGPCGPGAAVEFPCTRGSTYLIAVGGAGPADRGVGTILATCQEGPPACPPDFNGDGFLDFFDYDDYVLCFETGICPPGKTADFNGDDFPDFFDYDAFVAAFELGC